MSFAIIWKAIPFWIKAGVLCAALVAGAYGLGEWNGARMERAEAEARGAKATIEQLRQRGLINEAVRDVPACDLARELNPDSVCDDLAE